MSRYPLCEKLGLKVDSDYILQGPGNRKEYDFVLASEIESLLAGGIEVFGEKNSASKYNEHSPHLSIERGTEDTHVGILVGYKPIEKEQPVSVTKENLAKAWDKCAWLHDAHKSKAFADFCKELGL
jgi:hypothetical protein